MKPELVLSLDPQRKAVKGSTQLLNKRLAAGADLRICTGFLHNEHIDITSDDNQLIEETSNFAETVIIDGKWSAFYMTLRQPVTLLPFLARTNALSLFLYNQNGLQGLAKLVMDGTIDKAIRTSSEHGGIPKMRTLKINDEKTAGPSKAFIYDFECYDFFALNCYKEVYANTASGRCTFGSINGLAKAYRYGQGIKLAVKGLSQVLWGDTGHEDEIFIHCGSSYYYTKDKVMFTNTHPFVSVPADIPLTYKSKSYRYCWIVATSTGRLEVRSYNVFKNKWETREVRLPLRWFAQI